MANQALAVLESALRARKLDRTLTTVLPSLERTDAAAFPGALPGALPGESVLFGIDALDDRLRGGLPRGQLSELTGNAGRSVLTGNAGRSSLTGSAGPSSLTGSTGRSALTASAGQGRLTLLLQLMAAATRRGEVAAFVDTCDRLDVASAAAAGVCLDRLLWIRGDAVSTGAVSGCSRTTAAAGMTWERTLDRALKALNLVLQAGGFAVVAIDLVDVPAVWLKRLPFTTWLRVQRSIEGSDTACVLLSPEPLARSAGGLTLTLSGRTVWTGSAPPGSTQSGTGDRSRRLAGMDAQVRIVSPRRRVEGEVEIRASFGDSH